MANKTDKTDYRYVNDLRRLAYSQEKSIEQKKFLILSYRILKPKIDNPLLKFN